MTADPWAAVTAAVVVPVALGAWPANLADGPLPLPFSAGAGSKHADRAARASYFNAHTARILFGSTTPGAPRRGYCSFGARREDLSPVTITAVEVLTFGPGSAGRALVVVHLQLPTEDPLSELQDLTAPRTYGTGNRLLDLLDGGEPGGKDPPAVLLPGVQRIADTVRPFTVTLAVPQGELPDGPFGSSFPWDALSQWLFAFASARTSGRFPADPQDTGLLAGLVRLSQDWSALVLRDGVAFVGRRPACDSPYLRDAADAYVRSIYLDSLLLGLVQLSALSDITEKLAGLDRPLEHLNELLALEEQVSEFRNTYWWQHLTSHGTGNRLLVELQREHATPALFEQVLRELDDYARHATLRTDRQEQRQLSRVNLLLSVLTVLTVPLTLLQIMIDARAPGSWAWRIVVAGGAAVVLLLALVSVNRRGDRGHPS